MDPIVQLARVPRRPPRADVLLAGGLLAWAVLEALLVTGPGTPAARLLLAAAFTVPLVLRRRAPLAVLGVIVAAVVLRGALSETPQEGSMPFPSLLVGTFSAALYARPPWTAWLAAPLPIAAMLASLAFEDFAGGPGPGDVAILSFLSLGAWTAGWLVRRRAVQLEAARAAAPALAEEAVLAERARVARELHDVVAHSVSIIAIQAGAAEALLAPGTPAHGHVEAARRQAHEALVELRRLLGVLREDEASYAPQPGLERLPELVQEARGAGLPVELSEEGARPPVPAGVDLAAYRIVQEGLTNVRRHAGSVPTRVRVAYAPEGLELEVHNGPGRPDPAAGTGSGSGLAGLRERVRLYDGTLDTETDAAGGFRLRVRLPLEAPA